MKKKLLVGILATAMCVSAVAGLTACGGDGGKGGNDAKITEGVYDGTYTANNFTQDVYLRFYEAGEVIEGQSNFYYHAISYAVGQDIDMGNPLAGPTLGKYEVLDEEITMTVWKNHDDKGNNVAATEMTADKTVVLKSLDGVEYCRTGWDTTKNMILGIPLESTFGNANCNGYNFNHSDEAKTTRGVALHYYYCNVGDTKNASIVINHDGTYLDNKVTGTKSVQGTYTVSGDTYTLTAGTGAKSGTLTVTSTGATFTPTGETALTMTSTRERTAVKVYNGKGTLTGATTESTITVTLYDDNSVVVEGMASTAQEGEWKNRDEIIAITVKGLEVIYTENATDNDGEYSKFTINGVEVRTESVAKVSVLHTYTKSSNFMFPSDNSSATLELMSDGTLKFDCSNDTVKGMLGTPCTGTWSGRTGTIKTKTGDINFTITGDNGNFVAKIALATEQELTGTTAPEATTPTPGPEKPEVTVLYTLTGKMAMMGQDASGAVTTNNYDTKLEWCMGSSATDLTFTVSLKNGENWLAIANGTVAADTTNPMNYVATVTESAYGHIAVGTKLTLTGTYEGYTPKSYTTTIPANAQLGMTSATTLTWNAQPQVTVLYTLNGTMAMMGQDASGAVTTNNYDTKLEWCMGSSQTDLTFTVQIKMGETWTAIASGTIAADTANPMNFVATVTESAYGHIAVGTKLTLTGTYEGYTPKSYTTTIPANAQLGMTSATTLTWTAPAAE